MIFQPGDKLLVRQMQTGAATGGIRIIAGSQISDCYDTDGQWSTNDQIMNVWHSRVIPLDVLAGQTFTQLVFGCGTGGQGLGAYKVEYASIGVLSTDGTLRAIYNGSPTQAFTFLNQDTPSTAGVQSVAATTASTKFYLGDHLGTAQMEFSSGGWPVWQGQFAPYGQELDTQSTENHYKFTGKERDSESGLDYFGARYYGSNIGRFMSPDPSGLAYADVTNPQSLNLYSYVLNNPLKFVDPSGLYCAWDDGSSDSDPENGGASKDDCGSNGGHWTDDHNPCDQAGAGDGCVASFDWNAKPEIENASLSSMLGYTYNFGSFFGPMTPANLQAGFFQNLGRGYNTCLATVFGRHAPPQQTAANAPQIDATKNSAALGAMFGLANANGESNPNLGPNGTIFFSSNQWDTGAANQVNANYGTLAHEGANVLDIRQNPNNGGMTYGDPTQQYGRSLPNGDPQDPDTGAATERCMFGRLQYP